MKLYTSRFNGGLELQDDAASTDVVCLLARVGYNGDREVKVLRVDRGHGIHPQFGKEVSITVNTKVFARMLRNRLESLIVFLERFVRADFSWENLHTNGTTIYFENIAVLNVYSSSLAPPNSLFMVYLNYPRQRELKLFEKVRVMQFFIGKQRDVSKRLRELRGIRRMLDEVLGDDKSFV